MSSIALKTTGYAASHFGVRWNEQVQDLGRPCGQETSRP